VSIDLLLYQGDDDEYFGRYEFAILLRRAARLQLGDDARRGKIELILEGPPDEEPFPGPPEIRNLEPRNGQCTLRILHDGETVQERRLRVVELMGPVLADELRNLRPAEQRWGFRLRRQRFRTLVVVDNLADHGRPAPESEGAMDVDPYADRHLPFEVTPIPRPEAELVQPQDLGLDQEHLDQLNILMSSEIHQRFLATMPLSDTMEEGGFLLGRVTKADDKAHLVEVTHVTPAHRSGAGAIHFTFTGDSFLAVARLIEERGMAEELVGWYHTHLFGVDMDMGLSSIDVDLHLATFQRPWQVAALVNVRDQRRVLRFYGRDDQGLKEYRQWISDDSGRYRPADAVLGDD
jgi:proteasome lid subunit RPN8/RPN11